jgi:hypothetical protein
MQFHTHLSQVEVRVVLLHLDAAATTQPVLALHLSRLGLVRCDTAAAAAAEANIQGW